MVEALFIVSSDPRRSHRPAEAIRIAAGIGAWKKVSAHLYLRGPAVLCLAEFPDELVQGGNIERYLPTAAEGGTIWAQEGAPELAQITLAPVKFDRVTDAQLAALAARMRYLTHF